MAIDPIVSRRFAELENKAGNVAKQLRGTGTLGNLIQSGPFKGWAINVMNLLKQTFGEGSDHYQEFFKHYERFNGYEFSFENCRSIFRAAKEDYEGGYLFNVRTLAKAEVLSDALAQEMNFWTKVTKTLPVFSPELPLR